MSFGAHAALQVTSYNIRNYDKKGEGTDKVELIKILKSLNSDLIAVEEIYNNVSFEKLVQKFLPNHALVLSRCGGGGKQNVGFLYRKDKLKLNKLVEESKISDPSGTVTSYGCASLRPALLGFFTQIKSNKNFVAVAVHLKAGSGSKNYSKRAWQYRFLGKMVRELRLAGHKDVLVMGDFNTTGFDDKDADYKNFYKMLNQSGTETASTNIECTSYWRGKKPSDDIEEPSVLDHVVHNSNFLNMKLIDSYVGAHCKLAACQETYNSTLGNSYSNISDHCPVTAKFE
jgi:endonuclease/exonuclease/phosphatase family metal-dependent hydrolase